VYRDGREGDWPELVGKLGPDGSVALRQKNTAGACVCACVRKGQVHSMQQWTKVEKVWDCSTL
jgi:hypothetical protein